MSSDLNKPLGAPKPAAAPNPWPRRIGWALSAVPFAALLGLAGYVAVVKDPDGGRPVATSGIEQVPLSSRRVAETQEPAPAASAPAEGRDRANAGQIEDDSGVRVVRPGGEAPASVVIRVPEPASAVRLSPAPDRRLIERGKHGQLPKVGEDGARPHQVYARPAPAADGRPRIAILVGGLGISAAATSDAISKLPGEMSLAFAPYGAELDRQVQRARADGHEVLLQAPMEPFDYPDNDPGPHTLTTSASAEENVDRLRWVMSRFPGYVGVVNFMGARLAANEAALTPIVREIAQRGLMVIDDGSSGRSLLAQLGTTLRTPSLQADLVVDAAPRAEAIDRELARLEQLARERGLAVASASALPVTVERLQRWARGLEQRGFRLVPVTAAAQARSQITGAIR